MRVSFRELWALLDLDDSLSLTLSELEQGLYKKVYCNMMSSLFIIGIPRITGTMEVFDSYPAICFAYTVGKKRIHS